MCFCYQADEYNNYLKIMFSKGIKVGVILSSCLKNSIFKSVQLHLAQRNASHVKDADGLQQN